MKYVLGLTGPTGSGKSTLCKAAENLGWYVIDCDLLARQAVEQKNTLNALTSAFGGDILNSDGSLNRKKLAEKAFSSKEKTELLNQTMLPFVVELIKDRINGANSHKILLDAPTLYESGADKLCNAVCAVLSSSEKRLRRIISRDNIDLDSAKLRMSAGKSEGFYKSKTPYIIYNDSDVNTFIDNFKNLLKELGGN